MSKCPVKVVVFNPLSKDHVLVEHIEVPVYRRPVPPIGRQQPKPKCYWEPQGSYFIRFGPARLTVEFDGKQFVLNVNSRKFVREFFPEIELKEIVNGTSR